MPTREGAVLAPIPASEVLVDHDHWLAVTNVTLVEGATRHQRDAHRPDPVSKTTAIAIWAATSGPCIRLERLPLRPSRPPSWSVAPTLPPV